MARANDDHRAPTLHHYIEVLRRSLPLIAACSVAALAAAYSYSRSQEALYQGSAEVLIGRQDLASRLAGAGDTGVPAGEFGRVLQTQARIARTMLVAQQALQRAGLTNRSPKDLLKESQVVSKQDSDLLVFEVTDRDPKIATQLATAYARAYISRKREIDGGGLKLAQESVQQRLKQLGSSRDSGSSLSGNLIDKENELSILQVLQTSNASLIQAAQAAGQVQPRPVRNSVIGLFVGLAIGVAIAFLRAAVDTRVRRAEEITEWLDLPLLGRLPEPPKRLRATKKLVMSVDPTGAQSEAFRILRSNLEFANIDLHGQSFLITSAVQTEGKSTTIANLALAMAQGGRRVILVDLDLRRPDIHRLFDIDPKPGVSSVAVGRANLDRALVDIPLPRDAATDDGDDVGRLQVLPAGPTPPNVGEFVAGQTLARLVGDLRHRCDTLLIDCPPILTVGDPLALSAHVDGILVVVRLGTVKRSMLKEMARLLEAARAPRLGIVVTGGDAGQPYGYGGYYYDAYHTGRPDAELAWPPPTVKQ